MRNSQESAVGGYETLGRSQLQMKFLNENVLNSLRADTCFAVQESQNIQIPYVAK